MTSQIRETLGLDIGTYSIKCVQMALSKGGDRLMQSKVVPIEGAVENTLKEILKSLALNRKNVRISLSGPSLLIRRIMLPVMTKNELRSAIRFEAEKHIPFPINDCILDCQILSQNAGQKNMTVLLVAAKRDFIQDRLKMMTDLGLETELIDVDIFSLYNTFEKYRDTAVTLPKTYGLLNIGHTTSSLLIIREGSPFFVREISSGGFQVTKALMAAKGLNEAAADQFKKVHTPENLEILKQATHQGFEPLMDGLNHSVNYIENEVGEMVECFWVSGGGSLSEGADVILSEEIGRTFIRWEGVGVLSDGKAELNIALGNALRNS